MEYLQKNEIVLAVLVIHLSQWGRSNKFRNHCLLVEYNLVSRSWLVVPTKPNPLLFNCLTWLDDDLTLPTLQINEYDSNHHPLLHKGVPQLKNLVKFTFHTKYVNACTIYHHYHQLLAIFQSHLSRFKWSVDTSTYEFRSFETFGIF